MRVSEEDGIDIVAMVVDSGVIEDHELRCSLILGSCLQSII